MNSYEDHIPMTPEEQVEARKKLREYEEKLKSLKAQARLHCLDDLDDEEEDDDEPKTWFAEVVVTSSFIAYVNVDAETKEEAEKMIDEMPLPELERAHMETTGFSTQIGRIEDYEW